MPICKTKFSLDFTHISLSVGSVRGQIGETFDLGVRLQRRRLSAITKSTQVQDSDQEQEAAADPLFKTTGIWTFMILDIVVDDDDDDDDARLTCARESIIVSEYQRLVIWNGRRWFVLEIAWPTKHAFSKCLSFCWWGLRYNRVLWVWAAWSDGAFRVGSVNSDLGMISIGPTGYHIYQLNS